jgi:hypothetical protein
MSNLKRDTIIKLKKLEHARSNNIDVKYDADF